ncbi:bifunctional pyridoxal-dependent enzyme with beta-cystathionase and maltose regulon repressor activities [Kutzneria viridogrisea]|uniref:Bifunctional pyridoxal-dependent enzyme with beta-cystathionase and maltose regulon repressor activities n=1 Tax=Kutzneria viridogrisea TaxID=47990 RepID=A0ABR6BAB1_9PSEU|nr:bifunctional pyridoxal-dependent enzyme with beta-cystathionase and maltose regulon repressor activities [Kutzneria viridogrisea]
MSGQVQQARHAGIVRVLWRVGTDLDRILHAVLRLERIGVATMPGPDHGQSGASFAQLNFATPCDGLESVVL